MAAATENNAKISLKVLVHKEENKVVFAEADSDFLDVLFSFMTLPLGTIVRLLKGRSDEKFEALGSLNNLYQSVGDLPAVYLATNETKSMLLNPRYPSESLCGGLKLNIDDKPNMNYMVCETQGCGRRYYSAFFSTCNTEKCKNCGKSLNRVITIKRSIGGGVFVNDRTTFIVTDDLHVMPFTSGGVIQLLSNLGIPDASHLLEKIVEFDREEILGFLKRALLFKSALTYLLLPDTHAVEDLVYMRPVDFVRQLDCNETVSDSKKMTISVTLQKSTGRVLFAEADEVFVDLVLGFLSISLATVIGQLMNGSSFSSCMDNLYRSIVSMDVGRYFKSQDLKAMLLQPQIMALQKHSKNNFFFSESWKLASFMSLWQ